MNSEYQTPPPPPPPPSTLFKAVKKIKTSNPFFTNLDENLKIHLVGPYFIMLDSFCHWAVQTALLSILNYPTCTYICRLPMKIANL